MKKFLLNILVVFLFLPLAGQWKSFQIYQGDTINRVDISGKKQGLWIYFNDKYKNKIVQKGFYKDGRKEGLWEIYYPNGNLKAKITYRDNRQYGPVTTYYENGHIREQGTWKGNKWVGEYRYYYENGKLKYLWYFDQAGKRSGKQVYYYENGKQYIVGTWKEGKKHGTVKEYFPNGKLRKISNWKDGVQDGEYVEYYDTGQIMMKKYYVAGKEDKSRTKYYAYVASVDKPSATDSARVFKQFSGNGFFRFYNPDGKVVAEGDYKGGILYNGKKYFYDKDGNLIKTAIIENGRVKQVINVKKDESSQGGNQ